MFKATPVVIAVFLACPVAAQDVDCAIAMAQQDLNRCAHADWTAADAALNTAYGTAMALLTSWDANLPDADRGGAKALQTAQRAWITFRDTACAAEGWAMKGGSAEPLLIFGCMRQLTEERTAHLTGMVDSFGG